MMTIYIDENMPPQLARALDIIQEALNHHENTELRVVSVCDEFGRGVKDEDWIPKVPNSIVITQDFRIQRTQHQRKLYEEHKLGMIYIKPTSNKGMSFWEMTKLLINKWDEIRKVAVKPKFPAAYICRPQGKLKELE